MPWVAAGITALGFLVPILFLLSIIQHNVARIVEEMEKEETEEDETETEMLQQPLESSDEWQKIMLPPQDN